VDEDEVVTIEGLEVEEGDSLICEIEIRLGVRVCNQRK
jgi:hypothetical protein